MEKIIYLPRTAPVTESRYTVIWSLVATLVLLLSSLSGHAQFKLYWVQASGTAASDQYVSSNADGSGQSILASGNSATTFIQPQSLAVDVANGITYIGDGGGAGSTGISRFNTATGTYINTIVAGSGTTSYNDLQIVGTKLYWVQSSNTASDDQLCSANLDGSNVQVLASGNSATTFNNPGSLYVDAVNSIIYVGDGGNSGSTGISRFTLAGTYIDNIVPAVTGIGYNGLQVVGTKLYWVQSSGTASDDRLSSANLNGSGRVDLVSGNSTTTFNNPQSLYVDAINGFIYVGDGANAGTTGISRFSLAGAYIGNIVAGTMGVSYNNLASNQTSEVKPSVITLAATNITTTNAVLGGNVTADGGATVTGRGVVYSTSNSNPELGGSGVTPAANGSGTGTFSATISNLSPGTRYYVAAYATNSVGTSYGNVQPFVTTPNAPVLTTPANGVTITTTTPTYTGTAQNGATITVYVDGSSAGTTTANGGAWSFTQPVALSQGPHTVYARATITVNGTTSPASANSSTNTFTVDSVAPTVTLTSTAGASGGTTSVLPISFTATFSESVTSFSASGITVTNGSVTSGPTAGSGNTYTFGVTPTTFGTVTTVQIAANAVQDGAGNGSTASTTYSITYNQPVTAAPTVTTPANGAQLTTTTPTYTGIAPASSTVTVYVDGTSIGTTTAGGNGSFSLSQPTALAQGSHTVRATAQLSGQAVSANSNTSTFIVDTVAPVVSNLIVPANGTFGVNQQLNFTVNFSENVTVTGNPQLALTIGSTGQLATYVSGSGTAALLFRYTVQSGDVDTDGITLASALILNGGSIRDAATNSATLTLNSVPPTTGVLVDGVAPTVSSLVRQSPAASLTNATSLTFRVRFSEDVNGVSLGSFVLANTGSVTGSIATVVPVGGSSSQYDVSVNNVSGNGTLRLDVKSSGSGITDRSGNGLNGGFTAGEAFTLDQTAPTVSISSSAGLSGGSTRTSPIPFTVTFSESVTGLSASGITVTNGSVTSGPTSGSGNTYTLSVTPLANGDVTVSVAANVARDAAGNGNVAATPYRISYLPLTLTGFAALNASVCVGSPLSFTATVSNADGPYSYTLTNGTSANSVTETGTATAFSRTVTATGSGSQSFTLVVTDASQRVSASQSVTVNALPAVSITGLASAYCQDAASVTLMGTPAGAGGSFTVDGASASVLTPMSLTVGQHTVAYRFTDGNGCSNSTSQPVTIKATPPAPSLLTQTGQSYPGSQSAVTVDLNTGTVNLVANGCAGQINWTGPNNTAGTTTTIPVSTAQSGTFTYRASCTVNGCTGPLATAIVTVGGRLTVLHRDVDNYADNNAIQPLLQIQNQGAGALPLSKLTLRYYLTVENGGTLGNLSMNYAQVGNQNVRLRYVQLNPVQQGASGYVEYSFTDGAGSLAAGANSGPIQSYFTKSDYGPLYEPDDYSYASVRDQLVGNLRITAYYDGVLIAGIEPGSTTQIRAVRALTESKNGPSATQINTYLEVRNEGNVAINYSDLKVRYYFTSDGNERLQVEVDEGNVRTQLVKLSTPVSGADTYLELSFNQGGQLAPGASTGTIRYRISKPDGGRFNQADDYSYQEQPQDRSQNTRVVVLAANQVVWGQLPGTGARVALAETEARLSVTVLGNPVLDEEVVFEVRGAASQPLLLRLLTPQGKVISQQQVTSPQTKERHQLSLGGQADGVYLLQVSIPTQSQTVKVLKAN